MQVKRITKVVVSALALTQKGIVILKRARDFKEMDYGMGLWDLPGGTIEFGEDIYTALNREVTEETGCNTQIKTGHVEVITEVLSTSNVQSFRVNIIVACKVELNEIKLSDEHSNYLFVNKIKDISGLNFLPKTGSYLNQYLVNTAF